MDHAYAPAPKLADLENPPSSTPLDREALSPRKQAGKSFWRLKLLILLAVLPPLGFLVAFATTSYGGPEGTVKLMMDLTLPLPTASEIKEIVRIQEEPEFLLPACSQIADPGLRVTCQKALLRLSAVKERIGQQLVDDLHMWENTTLDVPWGVRERVAKESMASTGSHSTTRIKEQVVAALLGAPTGVVALGGSNTAALYLARFGYPKDGFWGSYVAYVGAWWNATFPHPDNYVKNSAISAASGTAPLLCMDKFLGPYPGIVTVEFNLNPTKEADGMRLMDLLTHDKWASHPAILNVELPPCFFGWGIESCVDNIGIATSSKETYPWGANWTDISTQRNLTSLSMAKGLAPYWTPQRNQLPKFYQGTSPLELFSMNDTTGLSHFQHINDKGHEFVGIALVRHFMDVILNLSQEEVVQMLVSGFELNTWLAAAAAQPEIDDSDSLCFATAWSFLEEMRRAPLIESLVSNEGWAVDDISPVAWQKKETLAANVTGAQATFRLDLPNPGRMIVAYFHSDDSGTAQLAVVDSQGREYLHLIDAGLTSESAAQVHMIDTYMDETVLPAGPLTCTLTVQDSKKDGFRLVGLFVDGDKSLEVDAEQDRGR